MVPALVDRSGRPGGKLGRWGRLGRFRLRLRGRLRGCGLRRWNGSRDRRSASAAGVVLPKGRGTGSRDSRRDRRRPDRDRFRRSWGARRERRPGRHDGGDQEGQDGAADQESGSHAPSLGAATRPIRGSDVRFGMGRWSGPTRREGRSSGTRSGPLASGPPRTPPNRPRPNLPGDQPPLPAACDRPCRIAAVNRGPHGPWPTTTNGDASMDSKVSGSVTNERAQSSTDERSFS
jgi:hypothetical protein